MNEPPRAEQIPHKLVNHGIERVDPFYWLRERDNPKVIAYLEAENAYTKKVMQHTESLRETLFEEIKGRVQQTDESVPYLKKGYYYYSRTEDGKPYSIYCRKRESLENSEQVMVDVNRLAEGHEFCSVRARAVSPQNNILAYAIDTVGRRLYTIRFKDLDTGKTYEDAIPQVTGNMAWANDNKTIFYAKQDPTTLRSFQIYRHELGTDVDDDQLVYEEKDDTFSVRVFKSRSERFIILASSQTLSNEYRYLDADRPKDAPRVFLPRKRNHEYNLNHFDGKFYIRTNDRAANFRLMSCSEDAAKPEDWQEVIPHRDDVLLEGFTLFRSFLVVHERSEGLMQLRIRPWSGAEEHYLDFGEPAYLAYATANAEPDTDVLRYGYTSMTTPTSTYDYDMKTREKTLLKRTRILGDFDSSNYVTLRLQAPARDGTLIPISLVYHKEHFRKTQSPLLLYGYGSYGSSMDASFSSARLSLLDRGFVYAIAHIRGGEELGRRWYEEGKLLKKINTFTDFIDAGEHLVKEGYANERKLFAQGGSAGGLLVGAVVNLRPELFHGVIAGVPFVDVVTTMLDDSIPLTTSEYDEWGNPNDPTYFKYMLSYSPYDNVAKKDYPHLLVTAGLHDSQVQYWEPAKWVARLRNRKTDDNRLLLKTEMSAGHGGPSGRYERYRRTAFQYAFLLDLAGGQGLGTRD